MSPVPLREQVEEWRPTSGQLAVSEYESEGNPNTEDKLAEIQRRISELLLKLKGN